jgi:hypothetical protein
MQPPRKVFLSYRSVDRERVRTVAEALLAERLMPENAPRLGLVQAMLEKAKTAGAVN